MRRCFAILGSWLLFSLLHGSLGDILSVASHFILFSGVTAPYSEITIAAYDASERVFLSAQVPTYLRPKALIFASRPEPLDGGDVGEVVGPVGVVVVDVLSVVAAVPGIHCE